MAAAQLKGMQLFELCVPTMVSARSEPGTRHSKPSKPIEMTNFALKFISLLPTFQYTADQSAYERHPKPLQPEASNVIAKIACRMFQLLLAGIFDLDS